MVIFTVSSCFDMKNMDDLSSEAVFSLHAIAAIGRLGRCSWRFGRCDRAAQYRQLSGLVSATWRSDRFQRAAWLLQSGDLTATIVRARSAFAPNAATARPERARARPRHATLHPCTASPSPSPPPLASPTPRKATAYENPSALSSRSIDAVQTKRKAL